MKEYYLNDACPVCLMDLERTALSRVDNKTKICRICALAEAKDPMSIKIIREQMQDQKHQNYECYLKS